MLTPLRYAFCLSILSRIPLPAPEVEDTPQVILLHICDRQCLAWPLSPARSLQLSKLASFWCNGSQGFGCSPIKAVRELGLVRQQTETTVCPSLCVHFVKQKQGWNAEPGAAEACPSYHAAGR